MLLGLIEIGRGINSYLTVLNAARDSARFAAQIGVTDTSRLKSLIDGEMSRLENSDLPLSCSGPSICVTNGTVAGSNPVDNWVQVRVCYNHTVTVGIPWLLDGPIFMCSKTKIRMAV